MDDIFKTVAFIFINIIIIGILMKVANCVGERIGIYKMFKDLWALVRRKK